MSDLQVSLLVIGVIVVGGVIAFNWFQQWRLRQRLEHATGDTLEDRLREEPLLSPSVRVEPQLHVRDTRAAADLPSADTPSVSGLPAIPGFDSALDYIAGIDSAEPISAAGLAELHTRAAASGTRFRVAGYNADLGEWQEAGRLSGGRYAHLRVAVQLVNRKGIAGQAALEKICEAVRECAARFSAAAHCPDLEAVLHGHRDAERADDPA